MGGKDISKSNCGHKRSWNRYARDSRHQSSSESLEESRQGYKSAIEEADNFAAEGEAAEKEGKGGEKTTDEDEGEHEARQVVILVRSTKLVSM